MYPSRPRTPANPLWQRMPGKTRGSAAGALLQSMRSSSSLLLPCKGTHF